MREIIKRFARHVKCCITGFDRIVFKGWILPLCTAKGAMDFCRANKILFKDYKTWMMNQTRCLVDYADQYAKTNCGQGIVHIPTYRIDKEELARSRQSDEQIERGIIGVWSCQEAGRSFRARYSEGKGYPELKFYPTTCKHLYYYFDHPQFGFMNIRLQTWFPYHVQVSINGREWLKRSLKHQKIQFLDKGNKLLHISDYDAAQAILDRQLDDGGAQDVARVPEHQFQTRDHFLRFFIGQTAEAAHAGAGIGHGEQGLDRGATFAQPLAVLGFRFLLGDEATVLEHDPAELARGVLGVDRPAVPVLHEQRQSPGMIDMGMAQDHGVDVGRLERPGIASWRMMGPRSY